MAVKAVVTIVGIKDPSVNIVTVTVAVLGLDPAIPYGPVTTDVPGVDITVSASAIGNSIEQTVQSFLVANQGYTFGSEDYVRLIGAV